MVFELKVGGTLLVIRTEGQGGVIVQGLQRDLCPVCEIAACSRDDHDADALDRHRFNAFCDALESVALAHACAGVQIDNPQYAAGLETAWEAANNTL